MKTIKDVAKLAKVSTTTVSRVLNNKKNISEEVKKKVKDAVKALNYRINLKAKSLVEQSSNIIGIIAADFSNPPTASLVNGLSSRFHEHNLTILLGNSGSLKEREFEFLKLFSAKRVRGVIFTGKEISDEHVKIFNDYQLPIIVSSQENEKLNCPVVVFDNYQASYDVVKLLIEEGHSRIAFVSCPLEDIHSGRMRFNGYINALEDAGLTYMKSYIKHADSFNLESGYFAAKEIIEESKVPPTAFFGATDLIAIGIIKFLKEKKIKIPEDIAVFGFDNIPIASKLIPSLSSVNLDFYEMGLVTADILCRMFKNKKTNVKKIIFSHEIIIRESSRKNVLS